MFSLSHALAYAADDGVRVINAVEGLYCHAECVVALASWFG